MFIEKSPFYNSRISSNEKPSLIKENPKKINEGTTLKFLRWIKGALNPLQNLPLISGIYSSVNSENKESDRDLVQNGLGGFLYGGPIGAIVGAGNWIFNKLFDNTPTEMFLEFTGISKIWKKKKQIDIADINNKKKITKRHELINPNIQEKETSTSSRNILLEKRNFEKSYKNLRVIDEDNRSMEFNYPKKNYEEKFDKSSKSETISFSKIHNFYDRNKNTENIKNLFKIKA